MTQVLKGTPAQISQQWYVDGDVADPGTVTVTITREDGTVLEDGSAVDGSGTDPRTFDLDEDTHTDVLDNLSVVWDSTTLGTLPPVRVEVVGDLLFTEAEARAFDKVQFENATKYPDALLMDARERITDTLQDIIGIPPVPRYRRIVMSGDGTDTVRLPDLAILDIRSAEYRDSGGTTWTAYTSAEIADMFPDDSGLLFRETLGTFPKGRRNLRFGYEYGFPRTDLRLKRAALLILMESVRKSDIDPRAMSYSDGVATIRFVTPGLTRGAWFSNPETNSILQHRDFQWRVPSLA